ncbi:MAG: hypothetical protein GW903_02755 [Alphaproteobacteria bacterium]|nr:hypothetical protein [Alphaproteobacteria bacterium]NCQ87893.1 hypothetical protein [Alphaproteobacteria bacterium]NCT05600.1 hypothetical protein [Alphaproteobacteria bacterium]
MNDSTDNTTESGGKKLQSAFGDRGTNVNAIAYGHPYAEQIVKQAKEILSESPTGLILVRTLNTFKIPIHVMKGNPREGNGYSSEMKTIFLQIPGNMDKASGEIVLNLAKSLREADQELAGHKAPDLQKDLMAYAAFMHSRNLDCLTTACKIVKELTNSAYFSNLVDTLTKLGLNEFYKAYTDGKPREELYDYYAQAHDNRGSI